MTTPILLHFGTISLVSIILSQNDKNLDIVIANGHCLPLNFTQSFCKANHCNQRLQTVSTIMEKYFVIGERVGGAVGQTF